MRAWPLALVLLAISATAACNNAGPSTPTVQPSTSTSTLVTTHSAQPLPTILGKPVAFHTADRNVGCFLERLDVLCNVNQHTWATPRKPGDCFYTWGKEVQFSIGSKGLFLCGHGENYISSARVLRPGQAIQVGFITCRATTTGVECSGQGDGFFLGRDSYRLF